MLILSEVGCLNIRKHLRRKTLPPTVKIKKNSMEIKLLGVFHKILPTKNLSINIVTKDIMRATISQMQRKCLSLQLHTTNSISIAVYGKVNKLYHKCICTGNERNQHSYYLFSWRWIPIIKKSTVLIVQQSTSIEAISLIR